MPTITVNVMAAPDLHFQKKFIKVDYTSEVLRDSEYEQCRFEDCDFSYADLSANFFMDCVFKSCRFVVTKFEKTHLKDIRFEHCSLAGIDFGAASPFGFGVSFLCCTLESCSFYDRKIPRTVFKESALRSCFFSSCDLTKSVFENASLPQTEFDRCNLSGADFGSAVEFIISPERNTLKKAVFSRDNLAGLLADYDLVIH